MASYISIHNAHKIVAKTGGTTGAPLRIAIDRDNGGLIGDEVVLFTDDHELSRKLADAINATVAEHNAVRSEREAA